MGFNSAFKGLMKPAVYVFVSVLYHVPWNMSQSLSVVPPLFHYCLNAVRSDSAHLTASIFCA